MLKLKCIKFEADWYTAQPDVLTWTPTMDGSRIIGGVIHGDVPLHDYCTDEGNDPPAFSYGGLLSISYYGCKTLRIEVTGQGSGWSQAQPQVTVRNAVTSEVFLDVTSEGAGDICTLGELILDPESYEPGSNPCYIEPDCVEDYSNTETLYIHVNGGNYFCPAHEFDVTISLV